MKLGPGSWLSLVFRNFRSHCIYKNYLKVGLDPVSTKQNFMYNCSFRPLIRSLRYELASIPFNLGNHCKWPSYRYTSKLYYTFIKLRFQLLSLFKCNFVSYSGPQLVKGLQKVDWNPLPVLQGNSDLY
jgi:hypothetical protein